MSLNFCHACGAEQQPASTGTGVLREAATGTNLEPQAAERRQLTILFCDLVDSTALADRLDPEELRDALRLYYDLGSEVVLRFGGEVADFAGDGIVVYFGHPQAYEDAAERAVHAGLALIEAIKQLQAAPKMQVRIGIASGLTVVGGIIESGVVREPELFGATVNLAARLQALAAPNSIVVSASTHNLLGGIFAYEDLGEFDLRGFSAKIPAFAVIGENVATDRFEAHAGVALPPIVNRERERAVLTELWQKVKAGRGQVCLLSGDPGIGKSRLLHDLRGRVMTEDHAFLGYAGSPLHQHTPLHPLAHQLRLAAGIHREDSLAQRRAKFEVLLGPDQRLSGNCCSVMAELSASPANREDRPSARPPEGRKEQILEALVDYFESYVERQPVLIAFEDVQWIDATTRELLDRLVERASALPFLLIVTFRTGASLPWHSFSHVTALDLAPLDQKSCIGVVRGILGNRSLPDSVVEAIVDRTDGVPLFVEELTKAVLESEDEVEPGPSGVPALREVPETLRDTLMARLDRHQGARLVAQIAAAIGREFSYELLAMVSPMPAAALHNALSVLRQSELIFQKGLPPRATYIFKHALVQDVAYESQLFSRRRVVHEEIADTLCKLFPDTPPEVIGHHYAAAGQTELAIEQYERAADSARSRSSNPESAAHFARALQLLENLPESPQRAQRELGLQIAYGAQLVAFKGNAASDVGTAFHRALALSKEYGNIRQTSRALRGLQTFYMVRGELPNARPIGARMLDEAKKADDRDLLLEAHRPHGLCLLYMGELEDARHHLETAASLYDPVRHAQHRFLYGSDPFVLANCNLAWVEWFLGFPARALHYAETALELSDLPKRHPHSRAFALSFAASLDQFRGEPDKARHRAETLIRLADRHHFAYWRPWGHVLRGWARAMTGDAGAGLAEILSGIQDYGETGAGLMRPYFLGLQAETLLRLGHLGDGLAAVNEALELAEAKQIRFYEPELYCLRAELLGSNEGLAEERVACLREALARAEAQSSRAFVLRALTALGKELSNQAERAWALDMLREELAGYGPGQATKLLIEAQTLVDPTRP